MTYICELSANYDDFASASDAREGLMSFLDDKGVLLHKDALKTRLIFDALSDGAW